MSTEPAEALRLDGVETSIQRKGLAARMGWASLAVLVLPIVLVATLRGTLPPPIRSALALTALASPALMLAALALRFFRWRRPGSIAVAGERLVLERSGHDRQLALVDLVAGHVNPLERVVTLALAGGDLVHAHVPTVEDGQRLLVATGLDASRRTMRLRLGETFFLDFLALSLGPGLFGAATVRAGPFAFVLTLALTFGLLRAFRELLGPAEIIVGADGIIVRQSFSSRFIPFGSIAAIESVRPNLVLPVTPGLASLTSPLTLHLTDGTTVQARSRHLSEAERDQLAARIDDARRVWAAGGAGEGAMGRLERQGRSAAAWGQAMRDLLDAPGGYRAPAVTRDALVEVVESPAAPVERRVGAALALAASGDDQARARIRVAAGACADEPVRVALNLAADGALDDEAIEEALAGAPPLQSVVRRAGG